VDIAREMRWTTSKMASVKRKELSLFHFFDLFPEGPSQYICSGREAANEVGEDKLCWIIGGKILSIA